MSGDGSPIDPTNDERAEQAADAHAAEDAQRMERRKESVPHHDYMDLTLDERLLAAQAAMPDVEKTGQAPKKIGGYDYLEDKEVTARAKQVLHDWGLVLTSQAKDVMQEFHNDSKWTCIEWEFTLSAVGREEVRNFTWYSEARDGGDKGVSKCVTQARKDFLRSLLQIPGGAEIEADSTDWGADGSAHDDGNPGPASSGSGGKPDLSGGPEERTVLKPDTQPVSPKAIKAMENGGWNYDEDQGHFWGYRTRAEAEDAAGDPYFEGTVIWNDEEVEG